MGKKGVKRKVETHEDCIDFSLSDLEQDRTPISLEYTVERLSDDKRRVLRKDGTVQGTEESQKAELHSAETYFVDLGAIDFEAVQTETHKHQIGAESRKRRYVSSVSLATVQP